VRAFITREMSRDTRAHEKRIGFERSRRAEVSPILFHGKHKKQRGEEKREERSEGWERRGEGSEEDGNGQNCGQNDGG